MKDLRWVQWISDFDMEPLIGAILRIGSWGGSGLVLAGLVWAWQTTGHFEFTDPLTAHTVLRLFLLGVQQARMPRPMPGALVRLGLAMLFLTPYVRVIASAWYFQVVERQRAYAFMSALTGLVLTYVLAVF